MKQKLSIPIVDLTSPHSVMVKQLREACRQYGFFLLASHGISEDLQKKLQELSVQFFAQSENEKQKLAMAMGGLAWRGYFTVGGELTSGKPDLKEGLYFGEELGEEDLRVKNKLPLHGKNLFPPIAGFGETVLEFMREAEVVGQRLISLISESLGLDPHYFFEHYTKSPTQLFRIFHYPPVSSYSEKTFPWGVGEHTDYGLLTLLLQDSVGGLEIKVEEEWVPVPPIAGTIVCNVGDMLDFLTRGYYRSAPHRVKNTSGKERYSFPFFFDPRFEAKIQSLPIQEWQTDQHSKRWDEENLYQFKGTYGDYLLKKVSKVFPELSQEQLTSRSGLPRTPT